MARNSKSKNSALSLPEPAKVKAILRLLDQDYAWAQCTLDFQNPLQLLIATILSAQCTDERVNQVTPRLFAKYPTAGDFAQASLQDLEEEIKSTGFYRNKAKNIQACCRILQERFEGRIPADLEVLVELPGIGRKTANVILGNAFHIPGLVVDTHVGRVSQRLGLTQQKDAVKIETDLMALIPEDRWILFSHQIIQHGRRVCVARKPKCSVCSLPDYCDYFQQGLGPRQ